jgi:hypothetical protein
VPQTSVFGLSEPESDTFYLACIQQPPHTVNMPELIEKLNDTNYTDWAIKMEALLEEKDLWKVVSGEETAPTTGPTSKAAKTFLKKQRLARAKIILHVENSQLPHTRDPDPKAIWDSLAQVHRSRGFGTLLSMARTFFQMGMKPDMSMQEWIASVRNAAFHLESAGFEVKDIEMIIVLTQNLPDSYAPLIVALDTTPIDQLTIDFVINRLVNEESRQKGGMSHAPNNIAMRATHAKSTRWKLKTPPADINCYRCGGRGHLARECPSPKSVEEESDVKKKRKERANLTKPDTSSDSDTSHSSY